ncbi:MAG: VOC family protein, partial [Limosilactobacillus ingluviei]|nr:VOC family protein [Limosilactobacillus ingluviei]
MAFNKSLAGYFDDLQHVGMPTDDLPKTVAFWEKLGFKMTGNFDTDDQGNQVVFMSYAHLTLEIWTGDGAVHQTGAINHLSLNTSDADAAFQAAKAAGFK